MATIALSALGMAIGGSVGGSVLGLSMAAIGRAVGASVGQMIDHKLMGLGAEPVESGRLDRLRLTGASEGSSIARLYGQTRIAGQVIWASRFQEHSDTRTSGKFGPEVTQYGYSISLAIALCEGVISGIGRIWADGTEIAPSSLTLRLYRGDEDQLPDPRIEAVEGQGTVPAYRGIAYVVIEDLPLGAFGNRVPQFTFEVTRPGPEDAPLETRDIAHMVRGVALMPGTGEYALSTGKALIEKGFGDYLAVNENSASGESDLETSLGALEVALPAAKSVSLIVSWFGDDLRCGACTLRPKVEQNTRDAIDMPWRVSGLERETAGIVPIENGRPVYGGTPTDQSVLEALAALKARGMRAMFYPFILMEQMAGNTLVDPWSGEAGQPHLPWRGRITTSLAPSLDGTPDGTTTAEQEVAAFFGMASAADFAVIDGKVIYDGPEEWSYRRFILHYAHLCKIAGGVESFCIGSEMRSLTQVRGAGGRFPAVEALIGLAQEVRAILGPSTKIGYAADWSEYHGYQPHGTADKIFHLDPLWASEAIDFIGIDNYMPLSDWRDGEAHLDAGYGSVYNLDYLRANVAGGEGFDWFYHSPEARAAQIRTPITDAHNEPWVWRYKDLVGWWSHPHHNRINGARAADATPWVPRSKPIVFTELGCAAIHRGTNQPNKFVDPKSSESQVPYHSNGQRDDVIQLQYLRAMHLHFAQSANNPVSDVYGGAMVDMERAHVWAWDARPFPFFPAHEALWSDGPNYELGHWLNGRASARSLASVVAEICAEAGVAPIDVSRLYGVVRGYAVDRTQSYRALLQPLMLAYGFDAFERDGILHFVSRGHGVALALDPQTLVARDGGEAPIERTRTREAEISGRVRVAYLEGGGDYAVRASEAAFADEEGTSLSETELPLVLTPAEARRMAERWLSEARRARETVQFALPLSRIDIGAGDVVRLEAREYRVDRVELTQYLEIVATEVARTDAIAPQIEADPAKVALPAAPLPVVGALIDLPQTPFGEGPHFAASSAQWSEGVALYRSGDGASYQLWQSLSQRSVIGRFGAPLAAGRADLWDRSRGTTVELVSGTLASVGEAAVLGGANYAAIGDGHPDTWEIVQFAFAEVIAPKTYRIARLLRGRFGTAVRSHGPNALFVLLPNGVTLLPWSSSLRDTLVHLSYGPSGAVRGGPTYRNDAVILRDVRQRPFRVCHIKAKRRGGVLDLAWVRQTRSDGESWTALEVPLGEERELYQVKLFAGGALVRDVTCETPSLSLSLEGLATGPATVQVMQLSQSFGPGLPLDLGVVL
ncbi:glycoside hydrolase/phage tail family protein [Marivivens sp. LCG002]|uniref:baseplate multidomain protein megatron n=1 Tax=Marivivens sp. LCG002 TaxID=3051171 RepID=UPI002555A45B|nr:glycoside hydrolase/phage tail family protein [Marivivens sp. LCG002]WIV49520.1 glycoside hydrolase/phage tail family protein [Marivivens sp. LCG002]